MSSAYFTPIGGHHRPGAHLHNVKQIIHATENW